MYQGGDLGRGVMEIGHPSSLSGRSRHHNPRRRGHRTDLFKPLFRHAPFLGPMPSLIILQDIDSRVFGADACDSGHSSLALPLAWCSVDGVEAQPVLRLYRLNRRTLKSWPPHGVPVAEDGQHRGFSEAQLEQRSESVCVVARPTHNVLDQVPLGGAWLGIGHVPPGFF